MSERMVPLLNWAPWAQILLLGLAMVALPLGAFWWRQRGRSVTQRLRALTVLTLFLCFDLVLFGAFTRLSDSGLGCPDWPGCYGHASPVGAQNDIAAQQAQRPQGPVTHRKAWIEMMHRYLATGVGALITLLMVLSWRWRRARRAEEARAISAGDAASCEPGISPWWPTFSGVWVVVQGAFGAWTVTLKLYPLVVTAHLIGGLGLLALLCGQCVAMLPRSHAWRIAQAGLRPWLLGGLTLCVGLQIALGAWVSTNDAVLACQDFPRCQGQWWPEQAEFAAGFELLRARGFSAQGDYLPFGALVAIHWVHRCFAMGVVLFTGAVVWALWRGASPAARGWARVLIVLLAWQVLTGVSTVVLGWPLMAALGHTAGAALWVMALVCLWVFQWGGVFSPIRQRPCEQTDPHLSKKEYARGCF